MKPEFRAFHEQLQRFIPSERLITDPLRTLAYGTDASFYRLIPQIVVRIESEDEVSHLIGLAHEHAISLTFRASGTSLSGQAITDSVLVQLGDGWTDYHIGDNAHTIRLQPGIIGAQANRYLAPFQRKIGPDPASINAARIGGIAANNASGMCCGTAQNSYRTLHSMRMVLPNGAVLDTGDANSVARFREQHPALLDSLAALAELTRANPELRQRIEHKYRLKNTTGYALNALIDFTDPIDILQHLMIGSEGTLGFIASITYNTVPDHPHKASALIFFDSVRTTCEAVARLKPTPVDAVELMDRAGLRSVEDKPGMPGFIRELPNDAAALLVETRAVSAEALQNQIDAIEAVLAPLDISHPYAFSTDPEACARYWAIRKGLFPAVGAVRDTGTTVIIEDVAFPVERLADAVTDLHRLFARWDYPEALIFGHALEGNLHFVFTQSFESDDALRRYEGLMDDVAELVVNRYDGSLKAEHGTGRNMAPYVELEWGPEGYRLMQQIKQLLDPAGILNPGVILNDDPQVHLKNLKPMPAAHPLVDKCIECGFCEPVCPSRDLTLTPRQRIVAWREISALERSGQDPDRLQQLQRDYAYQGDATCAACGLCSTNCPVGINTGDLTRQIRHDRNISRTPMANWLAEHYGGVMHTSRLLLGAADRTHQLLGTARMRRLTGGVRTLSGNRVQQWTPAMPTASPRVKIDATPAPTPAGQVVYLPSCASRTMGPMRGSVETASLADTTVQLLHKAGFEVILPLRLESLCCGMPFQSKGMFEAADLKRQELMKQLLDASDGGRIPIYSDTSPCSLRLQEGLPASLQVFDSIDFLDRFVLTRLDITPVEEPIALHVTCSSQRQGLDTALKRIASACSRDVVVPEQITCCGFAGDKGFSTPELNANALRSLKAQVRHCNGGYSTSRTCEIGLSHHSGIEYRSLVYLLNRCSRPKPEEEIAHVTP
ncbi:FAD-binding and (Fe-S)-binding domain-containing protein [Marinobacterium weihaiense]|uniref:D-lactate dehydrogenase (cytochrome) n=1 Tax=Marinobacterium weihaiense TaxID=2851016 RepID=A0ABS6MAT0_9GAMM|nr:FAD-binding and (Fe-S)-binding domain-containing protein [Marinobacterium weihaiense]MBV0933403.1 FAD-binding oxidoreductase [Marinobacterium weihaiense]